MIAGIAGVLVLQPYFKWLVYLTISLLLAVEFMFFYTAGRDPGIIDIDKVRDEPPTLNNLIRKANTIDDYNGGFSE